jgi:tRNA 2-thiouridine synthesizing protein E
MVATPAFSHDEEGRAMMDLLKFVRDGGLLERDPHGYMSDLDPWSPRRAEIAAAEEGIVLTEEHWAVIYALREHYREHGSIGARQLTSYLSDTFGAGEGRRHLYELFPRGPVRQACRIGGLPAPEGSRDLSFGSVQ